MSNFIIYTAKGRPLKIFAHDADAAIKAALVGGYPLETLTGMSSDADYAQMTSCDRVLEEYKKAHSA